MHECSWAGGHELYQQIQLYAVITMASSVYYCTVYLPHMHVCQATVRVSMYDQLGQVLIGISCI